MLNILADLANLSSNESLGPAYKNPIIQYQCSSQISEFYDKIPTYPSDICLVSKGTKCSLLGFEEIEGKHLAVLVE